MKQYVILILLERIDFDVMINRTLDMGPEKMSESIG
jgi:hypothetical protein